jgi:succinate dehydrogenase / fumarate reductase membrane anchor subunit
MANPEKPPQIKVMRTQLARARGLGAGGGVHHWYVARVTSIALVPLTVWFVFGVLSLLGAPQPVVAHWAGNPINAVLLLALVGITFHHIQLGVQVVLEDYVDDKSQRAVFLLLVKAVCLLLAIAGGLAVVKMALLRPY